jgi:hypothetical protein
MLAKSKSSPSTRSGRTSLSASLSCHAETAHDAVSSMIVSVCREDGLLTLNYAVNGHVDHIVLPKPTEPARTDGLWKTTCFEVFIRLPQHKTYTEFNASPSGQWAVYRFDDYREGMAELPIEMPPEIRLDMSESQFALEVNYALPDEWDGKPLELGLSAVIEETDGTKSYWALAHPPGAPDFHHGDCFALKLAAPSSS